MSVLSKIPRGSSPRANGDIHTLAMEFSPGIR